MIITTLPLRCAIQLAKLGQLDVQLANNMVKIQTFLGFLASKLIVQAREEQSIYSRPFPFSRSPMRDTVSSFRQPIHGKPRSQDVHFAFQLHAELFTNRV